MLDACTLLITTVDSDEYGAAHLMHSTGCRLVIELKRLFHLSAPDEVGVEREQFEFARASLAHAGFQLRNSDDAWRSFAQMRSTYGGALNALARYFVAPLTQWGSYRSTVPHPYYSQRPQSTVQWLAPERED